MTIKASNASVWVIRSNADDNIGGILVPDSAKALVHKGLIVSVGKLNSDPDQKSGRVAIFNKSAGFEIEEGGIEYTILNQQDIVGTDEASK